MKLTSTHTIDDLLTAICKEYGEQSFDVILDALKRQDDFCEPGAYSDAIHQWVTDNPKNGLTVANKLHLLSLKGYAPALVADGKGNWALSMEPECGPDAISVFVEPNEWKPTIEEAVEDAIDRLNFKFEEE